MKTKEQTKLLAKFREIANKRYVKGVNNEHNSIGLTFESQLNKKADSMFFPDYNGIEIKCTSRFSHYPIALFTLAFDGPNFYEMNRLLNKFGKDDDKYKGRKLLQGNLVPNNYALINDKYFFKLEINDKEERLYIAVFDINMNLIEKISYIEFNTIKSRLELKLTNLALVYASKKIINGTQYFRYYRITLYQLKPFEVFMDLLRNNKIKVRIEGRVSRSGSEEGRQRNKNLVFIIPKNDISHLFDIVYDLNTDATKISYFEML